MPEYADLQTKIDTLAASLEVARKELAIEASLERVRTVAMAMQKPDDMLDVCRMISGQLESMGVNEIRNVQTAIFYPEKGVYMNYEYYRLHDKALITEVDYTNHPVQERFADLMIHGEGNMMTEHLVGQQVKDWVDYQRTTPQFVDTFLYTASSLHYYWYSLGPIALGISSYEALSDEDITLFKRFRNVFDLAYRRFLDIAQAIAQTREAQIQTGLERVRSRTMAMQTCEELSETAAVFFKELIRLGISPNRLYIAIIDSDDPNEIWFYATNEEGGQDCSMYTADIRENVVFKKMHAAWLAKERSLVFELRGDALATYFDYLRNVLHMPVSAHVPTTRRVHNLAFFSQGFVGIASLEDQPQETSQLLERFADVFNLTYTRFSDLKVAEGLAEQAEIDLIRLKEEKARTENALAELRATQAQLIQAEKMASLGELTAGIAHEIQNPLNFVNNFAEVNVELIDELHEELANGNWQSATEVARSIKENESKIVFHGKRADGIVKGMLQHSRANNGVKEPTDINALVDEYLRLAYHGLRAKDKSFNAAMKTDYDPAIGKINIAPQDIGRVVLNIITNAFHAVNTPRPPIGGAIFQPLVTVRTKLIPPIGGKGAEGKGVEGKSVEISISDNGPGIPEEIKDKIFQPFFTTKPTGVGTGLGLSISYDIIKAHGGDIRVSSAEGQGTTFVITLPIPS